MLTVGRESKKEIPDKTPLVLPPTGARGAYEVYLLDGSHALWKCRWKRVQALDGFYERGVRSGTPPWRQRGLLEKSESHDECTSSGGDGSSDTVASTAMRVSLN